MLIHIYEWKTPVLDNSILRSYTIGRLQRKGLTQPFLQLVVDSSDQSNPGS